MVEILSETWDRTLGGGEFDDVLVNIMADEFNNMKERKGKDDVRKNIRAVKRLYKEASKVKDTLSANKNMIIKVPELLDYVTLKFTLERTLFEQKSEHLFKRVAAPAQQALEKAGLKASDIDQIEILGGGIRVPKVQEILKKVTEKEILHVHLNGDEAMAFGSTFIATNSSSEFRMRKVYLTHHPEFDYRITIKPIEPKKKEDIAAVETPKEGEAKKDEPKKEEAGAAAEKKKTEEKPISYEKKVMLYKHKKDYLGQKKTIQLSYDKAMKI